MSHPFLKGLLLMAGVLTAAAVPAGHPSTSIDEEIRARVETFRATGSLWAGNHPVAAPDLAARVYELRRFRPIWEEDSRRGDLIQAIQTAPFQGLLTTDYHLDHILESGLDGGLPEDPAAAAAADLLLTDAMIRLAFHLRFGKVNPVALDADWNFERELRHADPAGVLHDALEGDSLAAVLESLRPGAPGYDRMVQALSRYRSIEAGGGWDPIPEGPTLKQGMRDSRVEALRLRLSATGDLPGSWGESSNPSREPNTGEFDEALEFAVRGFQHRHGLSIDGAVGPETLATLNVPIATRIDQLRVNLERARWLLQDIGSEFVAVNIAAFEAYIVRGDSIVWKTRAQVGTTYRKTPLFRSEMSYVVFNPTWTVPPTILAEDVLPAVRSNPDYLADRHLRVLDRKGNSVDPAEIDWAASGEGFPYIIRQDPGPWNALGQMKFIFPNPHFVFIHDTPSRSLFGQSVRAFSSGCVRIEDPFDFSVQVLRDAAGWDLPAVERVVATGETKTVYLDRPIPVLLLYWTASGDRDGHVHFARDVYDRDGSILRELDGDFELWFELQVQD